MSTKERHERFEAKGWLYQCAFKFLGATAIEIWYRDGETRIWKEGCPEDEPVRQEAEAYRVHNPIQETEFKENLEPFPGELGAIFLSDKRGRHRFSFFKNGWRSHTVSGSLSSWAQERVDKAKREIDRYGYPVFEDYALCNVVPEQPIVPIPYYKNINRCAARREALTLQFDRTCDEVKRILAINDRAFEVVDEREDWIIFGAPKK